MQFVFVPYPFASRYGLSATEYRTKEEENRLLQGCIAEWIQGLPNKQDFDSQLPTVLAAHLHVRSAEIHSLYRITESEDVVFEFADLNPDWAYVAPGAYPQGPDPLGSGELHYCGSLDRLDFGEKHDNHGVLFVEVGRTGMLKEPEHLPIRATPFHKITLTDPEAELPNLAERFPDRETAIVSVTVNPSSAGPSRDEIARQIRRLFHRLYELKWADTVRKDAPAESEIFTPRADFVGNVRAYLARELTRHGDSDKDAILSLADEFLRMEDET